ncbi:hypothetical protein COOONC_03802 [Cooperia oncophora]
MRRILDFLELPWNTRVLNHEDYVEEDVRLSRMERSSDQMVEPVNTDALSKWVGEIPEDVVKEMETIAPMLRRLGFTIQMRITHPTMGPPTNLWRRKLKNYIRILKHGTKGRYGGE